ncbi:MAG: actin-binding WH2 domain-containing protein [Gemmatimonadetes bacterium]|nr:MAG: actin-binding WH2 domain-containing protein [Gemmatimonadota bacterium]PYP26847.1 MAG: actin-binding WH2 domain-containing protein [Gemmatimonadota bacterium]
MRPRPDEAIPRQSIATYHDFLKSLLNDRDRFFEEVVEGVGLRSKLRYAVVTIVALAGFFGLVAGAYSGPAQAVSAAVKLPFLFFATFAVCFPAFFVVQVLVGSRLRLLQVAVLVFGALALACVLLAAFVPITAFFLITGANYYFQHLLNITIAGIAGLFGMYALHEGLSLVCEKREVYPRKALTIMRAWAVLFAFVGIQLAWSLRPFLGDRNQPFRVFGTYQGNFYAAVIYAVNKLIQGDDRPTSPSVKPDTLPRFRGLVLPLVDTVADTTRRRKRP